MATNFVQEGRIVTVTAGGTVSAGDGVQQGQLFGVAQNDATSGNDLEIDTQGVYTLPKVSAQAWTVGELVYWTGSTCTTVSTSNLLIGCATEVAANPSSTGKVRLNGIAAVDS